MSLVELAGPDALTRLVAARQRQIWFRLGIAAIIGATFLFVTGWPVVALWFGLYAAVHIIEYPILGRVSDAERLTPHQATLALGFIALSNAVFAALGLASAFAGPWGLICGCLVWTGAILNGVLNSAEVRRAMIAWIAPPVACYLTAPLFIALYQAPLKYGLAILAGGLLNAVSSLAIRSTAQRRYDAEERERRATYIALHDAETGLSNRLSFERDIVARDGQDRALVVAVLGIDRFTELRGAIGYALATELIRGVAERLGTIHEGAIARLGTGELGAMFSAADVAAARLYATQLQAALDEPLRVADNNVDVSLTIGLALNSDEPTAQLLERASVALDQAHSARVPIAVFDGLSATNPAANLSLMSEMLRAIDNGEITNHYQPKFDLRTGKLVGVEALVRWNHPDHGLLGPDAFIPMAEETGRIRELTIAVLARALRDQARLAQIGYVVGFAINLSGRLLHDEEVGAAILDMVRAAAAPISLEITETSMMENPAQALAFLLELRASGIEIAIDDYGAGLSSLSYLKDIPAHELKIDKAFVMRMDENPRDVLLVRSTVALAHSLGLTVTAEGVESAATLGLLRSMQCDLAQGYHLARPMPFEALTALIEAGPDLARYDVPGNGSPPLDRQAIAL